MDTRLKGFSRFPLKLIMVSTCLGLLSGYSVAETKRPTDPASLAKRVGMTAIYDDGMSKVVAQGFREDLDYLMAVVDQSGPTDQAPEIALMAAIQSAMPFLSVFTGYEISGIQYDDPEAERVIFNADATVTLVLPDRIGEIAYRDFKAKDSSGAALGDVIFSDIHLLDNSTLRLIGSD